MADRREAVSDREEALRAAMDGHAAGVWTATPGIIESFDPAAMTATVQVALQARVRGQDGKEVMQAVSVLPDVPVVFPCGGGFTLTFPVRKGDECLLVFGMRCIDSWWQMGGVQPPLDARMHDPSDAFAILGPRSQPRKLNPPPSTANATLRTDSGSASIELTPDGRVILNAPGGITMKSPVPVQIDAPMIQASGDIRAGGVSMRDHTHTGVRAGGEVSGKPVA